ncbi:MAG: allophanate hydrolase, partial [Acetobacteraceae bacterium]|nr:allophanate hydrolase [Acetobacteraceae bacterium]
SPYGTPRNPFSERHVPGGSSSGSGVAVAAGIVPFALGTDTAGSGRVPAAFGNIVGLKPTVGAVSNQGVVPACRSLDCVSVFARTVDEALAVQRVIAGYDPGDPFCQRPPATHLRRTQLTPSLRIGVADLGSLCEQDIARSYERALDRFAETELIDLAPFLEIARLLYEGPWVAERTAGLRKVVTERPDILNPVVRSILEEGFNRRTVDAFDAFHRLAGLCRDADELFSRVDALLLPTTPFFPTIAAVAADPIGTVGRLGTFTNFVNVCGLAAFAVPAGFGSDRLPCGVTVIGPAWSEGRLAAIADMLHRVGVSSVGVTQTPLPPAAGPDPLGPDETALFCVGTQMSGQPLNGQFTSLGGRFLREAYTTIEYRLFTLGSRPALVRAQGGGSIAGEIWALPTTAVGTLLAELPGPLGLGTVALQTGPCLGFLAEGAAVTEAPEITQFGGWRAYLARA